ncbi:RNA polymerase III RPC4-domain-containing protein [Radiomyces spectabilis]|uniref:RNA polymerase III RPC4-domain-containing protein n=1 Tax=Radiomyces spectabilis TaxID=64574 RepID=UPI00221E8148|nr:RNA polymerase III RPC4-domain-containing protein [Radiomyces spectabilis]KAI8379504.1 RNA polymerase III RPC4-domain-containing protein [Radiomyces spectabilis]
MARSRNMPGGGYATYGGDAGSRQEAESNEETDMSALFWNTNDEYTPVVFPHVSRLASDFDPLDLSITPRRVPWLVVDTPEETPAEKPEPKEDEESPVPVKTEPDTEEMDVDKNEKESEVEEKLKSPDAKPVTVAPETSSTTAAPAQSDPWYMYEDSAARNIFGVDKNNKVVSIAEDELLCFQLPSILPKFEKPPPPTIDVDEEEKPVKEEKDEKVKPLPAAAKKTSLEDAMSSLELQDMPDGCIGKVYVYKSGRMKMKLGNVMLEINQGMRSTFLENVMVIDTVSDQTKKAIELGHIVQKFVCSPDMDELLKEDEASSLS